MDCDGRTGCPVQRGETSDHTAVFEDDATVYVKGREKRTWLWNLLLDDERERIYNMQKEQKIEKTASSSSSSSSFLEDIQNNITVDLTELNVDQLGVFNRFIAKVDDLRHVCINGVAFKHLIGNLDKAYSLSRVDELGLFYRIMEIADETDDLKHVSINRIAFNCLIYNFDEGGGGGRGGGIRGGRRERGKGGGGRRRWRKKKRKRKRTKNSAEDEEEDGERERVWRRREVYGGGPKHTLGWTRGLRQRRSAGACGGVWGDGDDADADRIAFNHLIDNLDEAVEEDGKGEGVEKYFNSFQR
ncbi:hypothetical protein G5I_07782 [Acromyrmex echinatior]|uniref:Uncharacterized protein n=1 Tax=Acromyrmex echinatior TaxID=103372 RepID=F4WPQ6_ACREC|nr:hypothetical protein G5I_07782 [Acromyrmex echinatior]